MPRIRSVKPSFFMSRAVKRLTDKQKLVWMGLWPNADDSGRLLDEPGILAGQLWALSLTESKLDVVLDQLAVAGRIIRYEVAGERYIQVTNWSEHQKISKPTPSGLPPVPTGYSSRNTPGALREGSRGERKGKEGIGGGGVNDAEPPLFCPTHTHSEIKPPCPQCADARRVHEAWSRAEHTKPTNTPPRVSDIFCPVHPGMPSVNCDRCAEEAVAS